MATATTPRTHYPETMLARTGFFTPAHSAFVNDSRWLDFMKFASCLDAPNCLPLGGSTSLEGLTASFENRIVMRTQQ